MTRCSLLFYVLVQDRGSVHALCRDRAEERRRGVNPDYAAANQLLGVIGANGDVDPTKLSVEDSKYLGGDLDHTHLVKGLDYALLQKVGAPAWCVGMRRACICMALVCVPLAPASHCLHKCTLLNTRMHTCPSCTCDFRLLMHRLRGAICLTLCPTVNHTTYYVHGTQMREAAEKHKEQEEEEKEKEAVDTAAPKTAHTVLTSAKAAHKKEEIVINHPVARGVYNALFNPPR